MVGKGKGLKIIRNEFIAKTRRIENYCRLFIMGRGRRGISSRIDGSRLVLKLSGGLSPT